VRWWLRSLGFGAGVGLAVGLVVGGVLGRVFMRVLTLATEESLGFETAMGAIIGEFTAGGTAFIAFFGAAMGLVLGLAYAIVRTLLPPRLWVRELVFVTGAGALLVGVILRDNREDFSLLPVTLSVVLVATSVALTALPVPLLVERFAPDRTRRPGRVAHALVAAGLAAAGVFAVLGIVDAYSVEPLF
jgi:hypothetical protein